MLYILPPTEAACVTRIALQVGTMLRTALLLSGTRSEDQNAPPWPASAGVAHNASSWLACTALLG
jgi:hypothetical protein